MFNHDSQKAKMGLLDFLDYVPIAGHVKGVIHLVAGDEDKAEEAFIKANRTAIVGGEQRLEVWPVLSEPLQQLLGPEQSTTSCWPLGAMANT